MARCKVFVVCNNCDCKVLIKYEDHDDPDLSVTHCPMCGENLELYGSDVEVVE